MATADSDLTSEFAPATREAWLKLVEKALKGAEFERRLVSRTADGLRIAPLYTRADDVPGATPSPATGTGTGSGWQVRQHIVEIDPEVAGRAVAEELGTVPGAISLAVAAPGQAGLPIGSLSRALGGVPLEACTIALSAGEAVVEAADELAGLWDAASVAADMRRAALNADPIGTWMRSGSLSESLEAAIRRAVGLAGDPRFGAPGTTALLADGRVAHEAGASEAQELAVMLASLVSYLRALESGGLSPEQALPRIALALATDTDLFLSIAKLRAARRLVGRLAEVAGASAAAGRMSLAVTTSARMMARRDPWVNLLRTCAAGMAAALGGADALTIAPYSAALGRPDAFARRIARNIHVVLREESNLGRVGDPAGGAWAIEALTHDLALAAWSEFQAIESKGGIVEAVRSGFLQDRIAAVATERTRAFATRRSELTGVSAFPKLGSDGVEIEPHHAPSQLPGRQDSVRALSPIRLAQPFEDLRDRADGFTRRHGGLPRVFLASLGPLAEHSTRSTWIRNLLAAGGIEAVGTDGFTNSADAGRAFAESGAKVACICSSDAVYAELGEATASVLKQAGARRVYLAGRLKSVAELEAAGVDAFLYAGQDAVAVLDEMHRVLEAG